MPTLETVKIVFDQLEAKFCLVKDGFFFYLFLIYDSLVVKD